MPGPDYSNGLPIGWPSSEDLLAAGEALSNGTITPAQEKLLGIEPKNDDEFPD